MRALALTAALLAGATLGAVGTVTAVTFLTPQSGPDPYGRNEIARNGTVQGELYPGDPRAEARLVTAEDERLVYVRSVTSAAPWNLPVTGPYRFQTGSTYTLALPPRVEPYTLADLATLAPETLTQQPDGAYLLSENVAVLAGARLSLHAPEGLELRLLSTPGTFVSIVTLGGALDIAGTDGTPTTITSWDPAAGAADTQTADGRAYLRVLGGEATISHARFAHLGFWSGTTGGLAITGRDSVSESALADSMTAQTLEVAAPGGAATVDPSAIINNPAPGVDPAALEPAASATITDTTVEGNAFGLFLSRAEGVRIEATTVSGSLVDGIVFHREVVNTRLWNSSADSNAVDGVTVGRSSAGIELRDVVASSNGRNGISLDGQPLADGPSAAGTPVRAYGDNTVTDSRVSDNGRYGIEISGGHDVRVIGTEVAGNPTGVVVNRAAQDVLLVGNEFHGQDDQSIAVRGSVQGAQIRANEITGGDTGIYVRNGQATVQDNELTALTNHAVTLVGDVRGTTVEANSIGGTGQTALYTEEARGGVIGESNDLDGWSPAPTLSSVLNTIFQPLTLIWLSLALLLLFTAMTRKGAQYGAIRDPYAERTPLTELTPGVVPREAIGDREAAGKGGAR